MKITEITALPIKDRHQSPIPTRSASCFYARMFQPFQPLGGNFINVPEGAPSTLILLQKTSPQRGLSSDGVIYITYNL